jgi:hypothetical protein
MIKKKCIICKKQFLINDKRNNSSRKQIRMRKAITCSKECSKIYTRVNSHIRILHRRKEEEKFKEKKQ